MTKDDDKKRLAQDEMIDWLGRDIPMTDMVTVYLSDNTASRRRGIYCGLVPSDQVKSRINTTSWDLMHGSDCPSVSVCYEEDESTAIYHRFGNDDGIEPLVLGRWFHKIREGYHEISEEFRLFHNLHHDRKTDHYIKIDDDGNEHLVAVVERDRVQIRLKEIRQFIAIKETHLVLQIDCTEHSQYWLKELQLDEGGSNHRKELVCWQLNYADLGGFGSHKAFSILRGKRYIPPVSKDKSGCNGFALPEKKEYTDFIIEVDDNGDGIRHTSNPETLSNYFGANPGAPNYLTAVHFRKSVLDKYYQQPSKYRITDGALRCAGLWSMRLDNHHDDKVVAWLGDLGRDLPYNEQLHWLSHNILPVGGVSETTFRRAILGQWTNSDRLEHVFTECYERLRQACAECLGWQLLRPLEQDDEHHFQCVRVPATDEQRDFDELVQGLTKILIDSLNERELNELIPNDKQDGLQGSIARLEVALSACGVIGAEDHVAFLRKLQKLRSSGSAHRKGRNYRKIAADLGVDSQNLRSVFAGMLQRSLDLLEFLASVVRSGQLENPEISPGEAHVSASRS